MATKKTEGKKAGPVTTADVAPPAEFPVSLNAAEYKAEMRRAEKEADERRAVVRKAEEKAGAVPTPGLIRQGPSALRDWKVSGNPDPEDVQAIKEQAELKAEIRTEVHK